MNDEYGLLDAGVLITGGAGTLGQKIASACRKAGARVCITSRTSEKAEQIALALSTGEGHPVLGLALDATSDDSLAAVGATLVERWGGINGLVNCAGGNNRDEFVEPGKSPYDADPLKIWDTVEKNLKTVVLCCQKLGPLLLQQQWSAIVNIGSMAGIKPLPGIAGYDMAKAGVHSYTSYLAQMLGLHTGGVAHRANTIAFGFALGEQNRAMLQDDAGKWKPRGGAIASMHPAGTWGEADDIVPIARLLLSPTQGGAITGSVMVVDRGFQTMSLPRYGALGVV